MGDLMQPPQIEYAPRQPLHWRHTFRRAAIIIAALVLVIAFALGFGPRAAQRVRLLYWQHKAMTYAPTADQVVYDDFPDDRGSLVGAMNSMTPNGRAEFRSAKPWVQFYALCSPPGAKASGTLFLHERRNARGARLVMVQSLPNYRLYNTDLQTALSSSKLTRSDVFTLRCLVFLPGTGFAAPLQLTDRTTFIDASPASFHEHCRWYAGQPDANNESHFTIRCTVGTRTLNVEGWLMDDDSVALQTN